MEEKDTTNPNEENITKKDNHKNVTTNDSKKEKSSFSDVVKDHKSEFKKIVWPKRDIVAKKTVTVIITSLIMGAIVFCMDTVYTVGIDLVFRLLG